MDIKNLTALGLLEFQSNLHCHGLGFQVRAQAPDLRSFPFRMRQNKNTGYPLDSLNGQGALLFQFSSPTFPSGRQIGMAVFGLEEELVESNWPWKCTMCGKCEEACPMNVEIVKLMRRLRSKRPRHLVPGPIHKGVAMCLERGNNLGIPKDDFAFLLADLGEELAQESCPGFTTPLEVRGSRLLVTVNSKEPFAEPDDMKWWWKIFYAANESWTVSADNWEGVNWGLFSGDDEAMKTIVGRIVDNMERLHCEALLLPE